MTQQTLSTPLLPRCQRVLLSLVGVVAGLELDVDRGTDDSQRRPESPDQVAPVVVGDQIRLIAVNDDDRRVGAALMGVAKLDPPSAGERWWPMLDGILEVLPA